MSSGTAPRPRGVRAGVAALLLLAACATPASDTAAVREEPSGAAPAPHALALPRQASASYVAGARAYSAPALEFVRTDECAVEGVVVLPDGEPCAGAQVLVQTDVTMPMPRTVRACTGADGRFRVAAPRGRPVELRVVTPTSPPHGFRHPVARVRVPAGGATDLIVRLWTGETIAGRVVDAEGAGVGGLRLRTAVPRAMSASDYVAAETTTSADGWFAFDGLPSGFATIAEERPYGTIAEHVLLGVERVPTGTTTLLVRRMRVGVVAGRVADAEGRPVAKRTVVLARKCEALVVEARTDAKGAFRAGVATPGRYVVRLRVATRSGHADLEMGEIDAPCAGEGSFVAPAASD